ncbi:PE family protein [Mycobacterium sp. 050134]|uniref:PE family protein n=1 Tax=Mycobacterium sp. 050134 TaxID=3096111 RepID=UPI002ED901E8
MSFLTAAPDAVTAAAGNLAHIGSALEEATAAASGNTTAIAAAAADDVSVAVSQLFGTFGEDFQALTAQAAAFHSAFVGVLNGGAAAYLSTEVANAEQALFPVGAVAVPAATLPIIGDLGGLLGGTGGTGGGLLGGLGPILSGSPLGPILNGVGQDVGGVLSGILGGRPVSLLTNPLGPVLQTISGAFADVPGLQGLGALLQPALPGLFAPGTLPSPANDPWAVLFTQTQANLQNLYTTWSADPFPLLHQVVANQQGYAQLLGGQMAFALQNFPTTLANAPATLQLAIQPALHFNLAAAAQVFVNQQLGWAGTITASLQKAGVDLQTTLPVFQANMGLAAQAIATGNYHGAVQDVTHGILGLFVSGFDTSNLSNITVLGPGGDLLPILAIPAQQAQAFAGLFPPASIPGQIAHNYLNAVSTLTSSTTSTSFGLNLFNPSGNVLQADAFFGTPLSLAFSFLGAPVSGLNGLATGATVLSAAIQTGNGTAAAGALFDMPAYALNGFLNGETIVDLALPVSTSTVLPSFLGPLGQSLSAILGVAGIDPTIPIVIHLPFDGLLVPPHPISSTVDVTVGGVLNLPISLTLGGTPFGGLLPLLVNDLPRQVAAAITP